MACKCAPLFGRHGNMGQAKLAWVGIGHPAMNQRVVGSIRLKARLINFVCTLLRHCWQGLSAREPSAPKGQIIASTLFTSCLDAICHMLPALL